MSGGLSGAYVYSEKEDQASYIKDVYTTIRVEFYSKKRRLQIMQILLRVQKKEPLGSSEASEIH